MPAIRDRVAMIAGMDPALMPGLYQFCTLSDPAPIAAAVPDALGMFHAAERLSLNLPDQTARALGLPLTGPPRQITLVVLTALEAVGLTAAVASARADHGIACNMVASLSPRPCLCTCRRCRTGGRSVAGFGHRDSAGPGLTGGYSKKSATTTLATPTSRISISATLSPVTSA